MERKRLGAIGEALAAQYLARQGYRVLARNRRTTLGELDLVVRDGGELVFVEVKTRIGGPDAVPEESVHPTKVARLVRLAESYLVAEDQEDAMWRIDVVAVVLDDAGQLRRLEHFRNAVY